MDANNGSPSDTVKKQEDGADDSKSTEKRDVKPAVKTLNRVPRACNACRKQKMRCEGADNPPCRRCRHTGLECLFEKPSREATLTGEAGLERIRNLEAQVTEIRVSQNTIINGISAIVNHLRGDPYLPRSPSSFPPSFSNHSPTMQDISPSVSTPSTTSGIPHLNEIHKQPSDPRASVYATNGSLPAIINPPPQRQSRGPVPGSTYRNSVMAAPGQGSDFHPPSVSSYNNYPGNVQQYNSGPQGPVLPPFSSIENMAPPGSQANMSAVRYLPGDNGQMQRQLSRHHNMTGASGPKRNALRSSNVNSADSSDAEDDNNGELPASGLVAPWEVLRGLADVASLQADSGDISEPQSRARTPTAEQQSRPLKRRKIRHKPRAMTFPDVVTKTIISEHEARELFSIFYHGCSTFLPVFDSNTDTFDALHERSPFAVDCICMVAARVRDGGGKPSDVYIKCLEEVQAISCATLFSPVTRNEAVQAMILVAGWSDNGWLSGGHAVRMAMELSMHKAWPKLLKRMKDGVSSVSPEDRELVNQSRIWFCLYLFEHQLSYGTGRPAILKDDESIWNARLLLQHPLAIEDDMRLVSTLELMAIRERINNKLAPFDRPVEDSTFHILREADMEFRTWYATWDQVFSRKYEDAAFYRQSLQIQHLHAELFHNATALRGIDGPDDVLNMHPAQKELAIRSIRIARQGLNVTINSPAYREGMKYAVHYTHATATFAASLLLRLARLFPEETNTQEIRTEVELLASLMSEIPGKRYALTLQVMLRRSKRKSSSLPRSPKHPQGPHLPITIALNPPGVPPNAHDPHTGAVEPFSPTYDPTFSGSEPAIHPNHMGVPMATTEADYIWRGFEMTANDQLPVWISDESLGGHSFSQNGMDAFLLPHDYLPHPPRIQ